MGSRSSATDPSCEYNAALNNYPFWGTPSAQTLRDFNCLSGTPSECISDYCDAIKDKRAEFCENIENYEKNPGDGTCEQRDEGKRQAKEYCGVGDRIRTASLCTKENLGNFYEDLAVAYCKTTEGKAHDWCSCYNVVNGVCDTDSSAAGCLAKAEKFDKLVEATPEKYRGAWAGREACYGQVCVATQGAKFLPGGYNLGCDSTINICDQSISADNITESQVSSVCVINNERSTGDNDNDTEGGDGGGNVDEGWNGGGIGGDDIKTKLPVIIGGTTTSFFSSLLIIVIIVVLIVSPKSVKRGVFRG